ncbi:MAG: hypothetical protein LBT89_09930, partial [Planctomycetaceae bacterium]|nr:hypothetical protein [Planctomycetaceae bacterium]
ILITPGRQPAAAKDRHSANIVSGKRGIHRTASRKRIFLFNIPSLFFPVKINLLSIAILSDACPFGKCRNTVLCYYFRRSCFT